MQTENAKNQNKQIQENVKNIKKDIKGTTKNCNCQKENANNSAAGCNNKANEYLAMAQHIQADFENYKRRNEGISAISYQNGVVNTVEKLLPALDSFKQAKLNIKDESVLEGLDLIYFQILKALTDMGVKKIECVGKPFDPNLHNAVMVEDNDKFARGSVIEEFQEGFIMGERVIRHSVVKINKE